MFIVALILFVFACMQPFFFHRDLLPSYAASAGAISNRVDLYNSATGTWSTAQLSVARFELAATTVGNTAMFAGGWTQNQGGRCWCLRMSRVFARAAVSGPCYPYDHSSYHTSVCRRLFECCGLVQQCDRGVVDGSAQRGARSARSHVGWEHGAVRWGRHRLG